MPDEHRTKVSGEPVVPEHHKGMTSQHPVPYVACGMFAPNGSGERCGRFYDHDGKHVSIQGSEWREVCRP